jgi:hypothetical protein
MYTTEIMIFTNSDTLFPLVLSAVLLYAFQKSKHITITPKIVPIIFFAKRKNSASSNMDISLSSEFLFTILHHFVILSSP